MIAVDILITTIGRPSLEQAILSGLHQTYAACRVVVAPDGPVPAAEAMAERIGRASLCRDKEILVARPPRAFGAGNPLKHWWINSGRASPWIRTLDDDDWLPPDAIAQMMSVVTPNTVLVMAPVMTLQLLPGRPLRYRVTPGVLVHDGCGMGSAMFRTDAAQGLPLPHARGADFRFLRDLSQRGECLRVEAPLYWYRGYRTDAQRGYG